jgi:hypothetical protein
MFREENEAQVEKFGMHLHSTLSVAIVHHQVEDCAFGGEDLVNELFDDTRASTIQLYTSELY